MSEARNATQFETSSTVPSFPDGILLNSISLKSSLILTVGDAIKFIESKSS